MRISPLSKVRFDIKKYNSPPKETEEKVRTLKKLCFGWEERMSGKEKQEHYDRFCSHKDRFKFIVATEENFVIGLAIVLKRNIIFKNKRVRLGGIGSVCVQPEKRRKGVATSLIKESFKELVNANCDLAYLCTNLKDQGLIKLYSQFGFTPLGKPHTYLGKSGKKYVDKDAMIAPVNSIKIFKEIIKSEEPFNIGIGNW